MHESHIIAVLAENIKAKKALSGIDESIVKENLREYFEKNKKALSKLAQYQEDKQLTRSAEYEKVLKTIRQKLHQSYGMFQIPANADDIKSGFLRKLKARQDKDEDYKQILSLHLSTKERIPYYPFIYKSIFKAVRGVRTILDLGCGLNPLSAHYLNLPNIKYIASDIDKANLEFIKAYFDLSGIKGETIVLNLQNEGDIQKLAFIEADMCLMLKLLETDKRIAEEIVSAVNARYIVASFSTVSLTGKIMSSPEREWLEKMLARLKYRFSIFKTENEIFYIIRKS